MKRLAALILALIAPLLIAVPAHAVDEPTPTPAPVPDTCDARMYGAMAEARFWREEADKHYELYETERTAQETMSGIAEHWQGVAVKQAGDLERLYAVRDRKDARLARLEKRIVDLRKRLDAARR